MTTNLVLSPELWYKGKSPLLDSYSLYSDPMCVLLILTGYFVFVLCLGPKFMRNREPYNIKIVLILYNAGKVFYNCGILTWAAFQPNAIKYFINFACIKTDRQQERDLETLVCVVIWHMTIIKLLDLLDTVFFVLRKKQELITFLHIQHHSLSVVLLWIIAKYFTGAELLVAFVCNTIVHMCMYGYYFIAAMGPAYRKYLWWKKYLTMMQIGQFLVIIAYMIASYWLSCGFNHAVVWLIIADAFFNLVLFLKFYFSKYHTKKAGCGEIAQNTQSDIMKNCKIEI